jgi:hypothetical protein
MIGSGMASTIDRSNFRQQPPPMKVREKAAIYLRISSLVI